MSVPIKNIGQYTERSDYMTDTEKFREFVRAEKIPFYCVATLLGITSQTLYNKVGNVTEFTQGELIKIREVFPKMTDKQFKEIFMKGT